MQPDGFPLSVADVEPGRNVKSEVASMKVQAEDRRTQIERTLREGIYTDPGAARVQFAEIT